MMRMPDAGFSSSELAKSLAIMGAVLRGEYVIRDINRLRHLRRKIRKATGDKP